jgi:hypothetical protein
LLHHGFAIPPLTFSRRCVWSSKGCPGESPFGLAERLDYARDSFPQFTNFTETLRNATLEIQSICGEGTLTTAILSGDGVSHVLCNMTGILRDLRVFFNCANWYPLYEGLSYETLCYSGTEGFVWIASTQFVIVFMTMVMLTLRITFYEVEVMEEPNTHVVGQEVKQAEENSEEEEEIGSSLELVPPEKEEEPEYPTEAFEPYVPPPTKEKDFLQPSIELPNEVED